MESTFDRVIDVAIGDVFYELQVRSVYLWVVLELHTPPPPPPPPVLITVITLPVLLFTRTVILPDRTDVTPFCREITLPSFRMRFTVGRGHNPVTVANRIEKIAADIRRIEREIQADRYDAETGYQPASDELKAARAKRAAPRLAELRDQHEYWEGVRAEQIADGTATGYTREQIQKGDLVKIRGQWREVVRANPKTVSVTTGYSWTDTAPYAEIQEHKRP
ncbi:hypothetical protein [Agromyces sp. S2-1-8]|uniref:hypothetical protein n=1 Tax=Agromyces sp. S2-1-8 TaxID=2897180 RepID=UPI001E4344B3|nr:hypothetical protein [Agromyces sp. S2-1-8]MCD5348434.1 hypothetical protein [Agromyces sp. S2-1-8]